MEKTDTKKCIACGKTIRGRSDKKFCNDYCRNAHNNQLKSPANNLIRNTNNRLSKNRRILEEIMDSSPSLIKIKRETLMHMGFSFELTTHIQTNRQGKNYFFCYEYGYVPINQDCCLLIKKEDR